MTDAIPLLDQDTVVGSPTNGQWVVPRNNAQDIRQQLITPFFTPDTNGDLTVRNGWIPRNNWSGVFNASGKVVQQASPAQSVQSYPGECVISRPGQGAYLCTDITTHTIPLDPASSTNPRYDLIYARLYDGSLGDVGQHGPKWGIVKGDAAATPSIPPLPAVDGVIADCAILRPANVNTVADAQITDLRKGTGLLGAIRPLLPGDLLTDPGTIHGERRSRITPSGLVALGAPAQLVDWWDATNAKWRGTQSFTIAAPANAATPNITTGNVLVAQTITIPDPGYEYYIAGAASGLCTGVPAGASYNVQVQGRVGNTTTASVQDGTVFCHALSQGLSASGSAVIDAPHGLAASTAGVGTKYSGSQTVRALVRNATGSTIAYGGTSLHNYLTIEVIPV